MPVHSKESREVNSHKLNDDQQIVLGKIVNWANTFCFQNPHWDGEGKYERFGNIDNGIFSVFENWCQLKGFDAYMAILPDGSHMVGVMAPTPMEKKRKK